MMKNIAFKSEVLYIFGGHVGRHLEFQYEESYSWPGTQAKILTIVLSLT